MLIRTGYSDVRIVTITILYWHICMMTSTALSRMCNDSYWVLSRTYNDDYCILLLRFEQIYICMYTFCIGTWSLYCISLHVWWWVLVLSHRNGEVTWIVTFDGNYWLLRHMYNDNCCTVLSHMYDDEYYFVMFVWWQVLGIIKYV